jgi:hypothetical protein
MHRAGCITLLVLSMAMLVMGGSGDKPYALPDEVVPHEDDILTEISESSDEGVEGSKQDEKKTLKAIINLRAYAIAAKDTLEDYMDANGKSSDAGLVNFLNLFGDVKYDAPSPPPAPGLPNEEGEDGYVKDLPVVLPNDANKPGAPKKVILGNVVLDYAAALGKSKKAFPQGFGQYLLSGLDRAIMAGVDVTTLKKEKPMTADFGVHGGHNVVMFDHEKFGLTKRPVYFDHIAAPKSKFLKTLPDVQLAAANTDTEAAAEWLQAGGKKEYKTFLQKEQDDQNGKQKKYNDDAIAKVVAAMDKKFNDKGKLHGLIEAGMSVMDLLKELELPTDAEMKAAAEKVAEAWKKKKNDDDEPEAVDEMHVVEEENMTNAPTPAPTPPPTLPCSQKGSKKSADANLGQIPAQCVPTKRIGTGKNYVFDELSGCFDTCTGIAGCNAISRYGDQSKKATDNYHCYFYNCEGPLNEYSWIQQNAWGNKNKEARLYLCR